MSRREYESGSDRIAEAAADIEVDVIINVQGDEPFIKREPLKDLLAVFEKDDRHIVEVASLMHEIREEKLVADPNIVKVIVDKHMNAIYFSRSVIPFHRDKGLPVVYHKHIGIYAYRKKALMNFTQWDISPIEATRNWNNSVILKMVLKLKWC